MKKCSKCGYEKPFSCFAVKSAQKETYSSECKDCHKIYRDAYYSNNRELEIKRVTDRRKRVYEELKSFKNTLQCEECCESHISCLDFHHLDPSKKDISVSQAVYRGWSFRRIEQEIEKCKVLCANCHRKLHYDTRV